MTQKNSLEVVGTSQEDVQGGLREAAARKLMPGLMRHVDAALQRRWGWFLYIVATK